MWKACCLAAFQQAPICSRCIPWDANTLQSSFVTNTSRSRPALGIKYRCWSAPFLLLSFFLFLPIFFLHYLLSFLRSRHAQYPACCITLLACRARLISQFISIL